LRSADDVEREWAGKACQRLKQLLPAGDMVNLKTHQDKEKYGRYLAEIVTDKGVNASEAMLASGLVVRYTGGARPPFAVAFAHLLKQG
jgi:endonuclease YncB( thermonuclease family)